MITHYATTRVGSATIITVTSSLSGTVFYHWYLDGTYAGQTSGPTRSFVLGIGDQSRIEVLDTSDAGFDPVANAPAGYPARRTLVFIRSQGAVTRYRIEQQANGGAWLVLGYVQDDPRKWLFQFATPRLADLTNYAWQAIPIDATGNDGTAITLAMELIVRTPDAPDFSLAFNPSTTRVTFAAP